MAKFIVVNEAPAAVGKDEVVINQPDFLEQIQANARKASSKKLTGISHLREVLSSIAEKYDHDMNVFKIKLVNYTDIAYTDDAELSAIIVKMLHNEYPPIFAKYLDHKIKTRPMNTKLVWYVGNFNTTTPFYDNGLDLLENKDYEAYITGKPKKVVGRPAVSNQE